MAWETRQNGRQYFYLSERRPDGKVRKRYLGNGLLAEAHACRLDLERRQRARLAKERQEVAELERLTAETARSSSTLQEAHYYAAGLHNPNSRGWRRRREMTNPKETDVEKTTSKEAGAPGKAAAIDLQQLVSLAQGGDEGAARQIRALLKKEPDIFGPLGESTYRVQTNWILAIAGSNLFQREVLLSTTARLRESLLEEGGGTELERLAVEQVISSFLQLDYYENKEAGDPANALQIAGHRAKQIDQASRRHMKAMGALMTLRVLAPNLRGQQPEDTLREEDTPLESGQDRQPSPEPPHVNGNRVGSFFDRSQDPVPMNGSGRWLAAAGT